ncbi:MAG: LPS export ABC transporter periplasmic protein LptC [Caldimonas sp.]
MSEADPIAPEAPRVPAEPWLRRVPGLLAAYSPLLVMAALALGTWWLVENTPAPDVPGAPASPRHEPDYTMQQFTVQRFAPDGSMRTQIEGDTALHFPDTDTLEITNPRLRAIGPDGRITLASAQRALANGDGSEVQLLDRAHVVREAAPEEEAIEFRGDFLHVFVNTEQVRSHLPVKVTQGKTEIQAAGMEYDNLARIVDLKGRIRAVFVDRPNASLKGAGTSTAASAPATKGTAR